MYTIKMKLIGQSEYFPLDFSMHHTNTPTFHNWIINIYFLVLERSVGSVQLLRPTRQHIKNSEEIISSLLQQLIYHYNLPQFSLGFLPCAA